MNVLCSFLTIYALLCSNVVVHLSDHNGLWSLRWTTTDDEPMRGVWRKNWAENCPNTVQKGFRASHTFRLGSSGVSYYSRDSALLKKDDQESVQQKPLK